MKEKWRIPIHIGNIWQLKFKPIGLIVTPPAVNIYNYRPICEDLPNHCYVATSTYESEVLDLPIYLYKVTFEYSKDA